MSIELGLKTLLSSFSAEPYHVEIQKDQLGLGAQRYWLKPARTAPQAHTKG